MIATFIGISGSGKSRIADELRDEGFTVISPDQLRKELTGDISDQTRNREVFVRAYQLLSSSLSRRDDVVFDATNLNWKSLRAILDHAKEYYDQEVIIYLMLDSIDLELCKSRVAKDIADGKDRSTTVNTDGLLENMHAKFLAFSLEVPKLIEPYENVTIVEVGPN